MWGGGGEDAYIVCVCKNLRNFNLISYIYLFTHLSYNKMIINPLKMKVYTC